MEKKPFLNQSIENFKGIVEHFNGRNIKKSTTIKGETNYYVEHLMGYIALCRMYGVHSGGAINLINALLAQIDSVGYRLPYTKFGGEASSIFDDTFKGKNYSEKEKTALNPLLGTELSFETKVKLNMDLLKQANYGYSDVGLISWALHCAGYDFEADNLRKKQGKIFNYCSYVDDNTKIKQGDIVYYNGRYLFVVKEENGFYHLVDSQDGFEIIVRDKNYILEDSVSLVLSMDEYYKNKGK